MLFAQQQRMKVMQKIRRTFINADKIDKGIFEGQLVAQICGEFGSTERKAKEYIQELLNSGFIEKDVLGLWLKDKSYKDKEDIDKIMAEIVPAEAAQ